jgi:DNA-binding MltR family transcriptional regulator
MATKRQKDGWDKTGKKILDSLSREPDRSHAILAVTALENLLGDLLERSMVEATPTALFEGYGPLSSLSARIDLTFALGLLSVGERRELHMLRKVRNEFAHSVDASLNYSKEPVCSIIRDLQLSVSKLRGGHRRAARVEFEFSCIVLIGAL